MQEKELDYQKALCSFFKGDHYATLSGIQIERVSEQETTVSALVNQTHLNGNGCVQGGMLYTTADFAFAVHSNYLHPATVTQGGQITYLRPASCKKIVATAKEIERSGHNTVAEVLVKDEEGTTLCVCHFNGFVKDVEKASLLERYRKEGRIK